MSKNNTDNNMKSNKRLKRRLESEFDSVQPSSMKKSKGPVESAKGRSKSVIISKAKNTDSSSKGHNNNAVLCKGGVVKKLKRTRVEKIKEKFTTNRSSPIIQTRGMKKQNKGSISLDHNKSTELNIQGELNKLNEIDNLTSSEIVDGERVLEDDGVELLINGSDLEDDFPEAATDVTENDEDLGTVSSSEDDEVEFADSNKLSMASKVVKVNHGEKTKVRQIFKVCTFA